MALRNSRCPNCGYPNDEIASLCEQCGAALVQSATTPWHGGLAVGGLLVGLLLWFVGGLLLNTLFLFAPGSTAAVADALIALIALAIAIFVGRARGRQATFIVSLLIPVIGGFAACSALFFGTLR